ncbi:hypothetical protein NP233_g3421 [Leucocoprinus birnbaumii]|uniref:BTB domain-containing protein n=1 Tax=Leucocoprinus birnbaumii TaxID=56174 RepID=A0AAD5YWG1_9AGAR|nr:hypothetical protein NP233_g3421 [Leucocoprinus birnbaumii]
MELSSLVRDELYYFEDGNCIIQVENRLFNLHRFILRRASTVFQDMFSGSPSSNLWSAEGSSDVNPIVCEDTVAAFQAWCWALYVGQTTRFDEAQIGLDASAAGFTLEQFAHIGLLAHKYQCERIEPWALKQLEQKLDGLNRNRQSVALPPREILEYLIRTSVKCDWSESSIRVTLEDFLLSTIPVPSEGSFRTGSAAPIDGVGLSLVLNFAESIGSKTLEARAYYRFLAWVGWNLIPRLRFSRSSGTKYSYPDGNAHHRAVDLDALSSKAAGLPHKWDPLGALNKEQQARLLNGFDFLSSLRRELQRPPNVTALTCGCFSFTRSLPDSWEREARLLDRQLAYDDIRMFLAVAVGYNKYEIL